MPIRISLVPAWATPPPTRPARHMAPRYLAQRALRAIMMHFSPYLLISRELVPSPYFAAFMAGNHLRRFGAGTFVRATRNVDLGAVCAATGRVTLTVGRPLPVYPDQRTFLAF